MVSTLKKAVLATVATTALTTSVFAADIIKIDGSSTVYPITEAVAEEFQKE
ncbi:MAG: protein sphX, partial [Betaproteobacteria bacterium]|nr:protein sphX [Betaproteobacteria bacterium]